MEFDTNNPEQIKALIQMLQNLLPDTDNNSTASKSKIKTKKQKAKNNVQQNNKFIDMPEKNMHKSDSRIDKKLNIAPPTPRARKFVPVEVRCRSCGKIEKVNPAIIPESVDRYKCNKCATYAGN